MHALWAIFDRRGGRINEVVRQRMVTAMAHRPRERIGHHDSPGVWLGALCWPTSARERAETQPVRLEQGDGPALLLTLDGRIDNRDELLAALAVSEGEVGGDAALVLHAYRRWGLQAFARLCGDYALVLFDAAKQTLVAARDPSGVRPLYGSISDQRACFATELSALQAIGLAGETDEDSVVERLLNTVNSNDRTLYRGIQRLPPAHLWVVTPNSERVSRFHDWRDVAPLPARSEAHYVERFRDTLAEAVRCRLEGDTPVALELSGGLDSSSICVVASEQSAAPPLVMQSLVFPDLPCDERPFIDAVSAQLRLPHEAHPATPLSMALALEQATRDADVPAYPNGVMSRDLRLSAKRRGCRALLSGSGCDEWWTGSRLTVAERLRRGQWPAALSEMKRSAWRSGGWPKRADITNTLKLSVGPWLPWRLRQLYHQQRSRSSPWPWIEPALLERTEAWSRLHQPPRRDPADDWTVQDVIDIVEAGWVFHAYEMEAREAASYGQELRLPFADRRLCELSVSLPLSLRTRSPATKYLLREAMRPHGSHGGLPELVRSRTSKAEFSHLYVGALQAGERALKQGPLQVADRGWVNRAKYWQAVSAVLGRAQQTPGGWVAQRQDCTAVQLLWCVMSLELWLQSAQPT